VYVKKHTVRKGGRHYVHLRLVEASRNEQGQVATGCFARSDARTS
jgi:hypothetical protein